MQDKLKALGQQRQQRQNNFARNAGANIVHAAPKPSPMKGLMRPGIPAVASKNT